MEENHNTILKQAVRAVLKPEGLLQRGSSRTWIDDNGWFFTVVEFQADWCSKGSCLNIGPWYLCNRGAALNPGKGVFPGDREPGWASYKGDGAAFAQEIDAMARRALKHVMEYRALSSPRAFLEATAQLPRRFIPWDWWNQFMTAALEGDIPLCQKTYEEFLLGAQKFASSMTNEIQAEMERLMPLSNSPGNLHGYIVEQISAQRAFWRSKPGLKRLAVHPEFC